MNQCHTYITIRTLSRFKGDAMEAPAVARHLTNDARQETAVWALQGTQAKFFEFDDHVGLIAALRKQGFSAYFSTCSKEEIEARFGQLPQFSTKSTMKRFLVFAWDADEAQGGMNDLIGGFDDFADAEVSFKDRMSRDCAHIYDVTLGAIIVEHNC